MTQQLAQQHIHLDLIACERAEAEKGLNDGSVDIAVFQALNRTVNDSLHWRAVGSVSLAVYAREGFFEHEPVSLLHLASKTQLMPFRDLPPALAARLQIADRIARVNEMSLLEALLQSGCGWAFLPVHFQVERLEGVGRVETEVGDKGLSHPLVALWKPGRVNMTVLEALAQCM